MKRVRDVFLHFVRKEDGASITEYALTLALITLVCVIAVTIFGRQISDKFVDFSDTLS